MRKALVVVSAAALSLTACQADVGPYVVDIEPGPYQGSLKVIKCKTTVTNAGQFDVYDQGQCTTKIVIVPPRQQSGQAPAAPAPRSSAAPASAATPSTM